MVEAAKPPEAPHVARYPEDARDDDFAWKQNYETFLRAKVAALGARLGGLR